MKKIIGIWAQDKNGLIGSKGILPWHLPSEMKHFKSSTMGAAIISGRKTFEGMNKRVLPGRVNLVLTRDLNYQSDNVIVVHDREEVLNWFGKQDKSLYVTGGAELFRLFEHDFDELLRTVVEGDFEGDTWFPKDFDLSKFEMLSSQMYEADEKNSHAFEIQNFHKVRN
ncbi:dihydrofolate reductase [Lactovum miscens]|uniref:Dihydrofolate reductase n=1 Tax=Lactovum miscens TaxID=190387 RepID=A0A841C8F9_9LACT|nr:dihydrofolate reductase [Lactovum miscens]MBB5888634.1 dihydrofolate reductase [Lactovum miscens]